MGTLSAALRSVRARRRDDLRVVRHFSGSESALQPPLQFGWLQPERQRKHHHSFPSAVTLEQSAGAPRRRGGVTASCCPQHRRLDRATFKRSSSTAAPTVPDRRRTDDVDRDPSERPGARPGHLQHRHALGWLVNHADRRGRNRGPCSSRPAPSRLNAWRTGGCPDGAHRRDRLRVPVHRHFTFTSPWTPEAGEVCAFATAQVTTSASPTSGAGVLIGELNGGSSEVCVQDNAAGQDESFDLSNRNRPERRS